MKFKVQLTEKAERDLDCALAWFNEQCASAAAAKWLAQMLRAIGTLETTPNRYGLIS